MCGFQPSSHFMLDFAAKSRESSNSWTTCNDQREAETPQLPTQLRRPRSFQRNIVNNQPHNCAIDMEIVRKTQTMFFIWTLLFRIGEVTFCRCEKSWNNGIHFCGAKQDPCLPANNTDFAFKGSRQFSCKRAPDAANTQTAQRRQKIANLNFKHCLGNCEWV